MAREIPFFKPDISNAERRQIEEVLDLQGASKIEDLEKTFIKRTGAAYAVSANSGTSALHMAMCAMDLKRGDKIICSVNSFPSVPEVVRHFDAEPIFVDIDSEDFNINLGIAQQQHFNTFNDFFTRKLKPEFRPVNNDSSVVVSPGDGKILAYQNIANQNFIIKGYKFDINTFLQNDSLAALYRNGSMISLRLCPTDYHRYHFPLGGTVLLKNKINGELYSVSPIALHSMVDIFLLNKREYIILANRRFGDIVMAEVGATMVGSIVQTYTDNQVVKGEEMGYFKFGGSSIVLLFKKGTVNIDSDLLENTRKGLETQVKMGEEIGKALSN
jgi:phosphatidylserine decarboxylase precursor